MVSPDTQSSLGLAKLMLRGPDATSFIQGYVTCDLDALEKNVVMPMACCNIKGRVLANGWMIRRIDAVDIFVHASVAKALRAHLKKYLVFAKCELEPELAIGAPPLKPKRFAIADEPASQAIPLLRPFGWFLVPAEDAADDDLDKRCIDAGIGIVSAPVAERFLPQMLGLTDWDAVSFTKGCYLGQEVVARAQHRGAVKRRLERFRWRGALPVAGDATSPAGTIIHAVSDAADANAGSALAVTAASDAKLSGDGFELTPAPS